MKRTYLVLTLMALSLVLTLVPVATSGATVEAQAQATYYAYFPVIDAGPEIRWPPMRVERFVTDPNWEMAYLKNDPKDGFFQHAPDTETYLGYITDNSALMVAWPGWRIRGDYKLEVDARHVSPHRKSFNGLGIAFNATDDWKRFYALMLAAGGAQHAWAVVDFNDTHAKYLTNGGYRGGPNFMRNWENYNHLEIRVIDGQIHAYCNGKWLPGGTATGKVLADDRRVGIVVTSYEFSNGLVEFDNFQLTPLYPGDPEYEEVIQAREVRATLDTLEFDTPPMDLH
jgi:hypothetical protein